MKRTNQDIEFLSPAGSVHMGNVYFDLAKEDHFWIQRRFEVLRILAEQRLREAVSLAEFGCGHGVLQLQVEQAFHKTIDGFDLNRQALQQGVRKKSRSFCYDVRDRKKELEGHYDLILLFDVLEHIEHEKDFLEALIFHLADGGSLIINVPAMPSLFSAYDVANGHFRRYTRSRLRQAYAKLPLIMQNEVYWGLPMIPVLFLRKLILTASGRNLDGKQALGFHPPAPWLNRLLYAFSRCEAVRLNPLGTSLMTLLRKGRSIC